MGRIQRKKTSRKKQKQSVKPDAELQAGKPAEKKEALHAVALKDEVKKQVVPQQKQTRVTKTASGKTEKGFIDKGLQFLREVKVELKKVTWPTRKQTLGSTAVVIVLVLIISLFLGIVDFGLSNLLRVVFN